MCHPRRPLPPDSGNPKNPKKNLTSVNNLSTCQSQFYLGVLGAIRLSHHRGALLCSLAPPRSSSLTGSPFFHNHPCTSQHRISLHYQRSGCGALQASTRERRVISKRCTTERRNREGRSRNDGRSRCCTGNGGEHREARVPKFPPTLSSLWPHTPSLFTVDVMRLPHEVPTWKVCGSPETWCL